MVSDFQHDMVQFLQDNTFLHYAAGYGQMEILKERRLGVGKWGTLGTMNKPRGCTGVPDLQTSVLLL